jgi:hypothetical protein
MARIDAIIPEDLYDEFKQAILTKMGGKKGNMKLALIAAIRAWIKQKA